ncbi:hypothetical protein PYH37_003158 [Sinorhizobium numidicum]|uniref:SMI1/KNR4 family protein n=2 Tax=Sinorhizobium numidicum TaxID=680248 RepID=A0ABY8D232_9HYPH|nr:hypothetical protein [Sinorhizobium numidicum]WEX78285.1 hypothetical protein PYH37_003158 [Sinorhizobium numidicum]WEX84944.1 hypothetical protein PYH38_003871 [Sinorhizobium numidicum]
MEIAVPAPPPQTGEAAIPMALLELELSLDHFSGNKEDFAAFIRTVADDVGGEFLFALPASGLIEDCLTIAAIRYGETEDKAPMILFVCLDGDGSTIRVEQPSERTADLKSFAEAFVGVLEQI